MLQQRNDHDALVCGEQTPERLAPQITQGGDGAQRIHESCGFMRTVGA
jgi:hypothetical protein